MKRILIVEDEAIVAMVMEEMIQDLGYEVVGPAGTVVAAEAAIAANAIDAALLDLHIGGTSALPLARLLAARNVPFAFATGESSPAAVEFPHARILHKPFDGAALQQTVAALLG